MDKKKIFIIGCLVISLVLNFVLFNNIRTVRATVEENYKVELEEKEDSVSALESMVADLNSSLDSSTPEEKKELANTKYGVQEEFKNAASEFINIYLEYDTNSLKERREELLAVAEEDLVNRIAPEPVESNSENQLSSDPTFTATIKEMKVYITSVDDVTRTSEVLADVVYDTKSTEGEATVKSIVRLSIKTDGNENKKVTNYEYYPIN